MKKITITLFILITSIQSLASIGIEDAPGYHKKFPSAMELGSGRA